MRIASKNITQQNYASDNDSPVQKMKVAVHRRRHTKAAAQSERVRINPQMNIFRDFLSQDINGLCTWMPIALEHNPKFENRSK